LLAGAVRRLSAHGIDPMQADIEAHYRWIDGVSARATAGPPADPASQAAAAGRSAPPANAALGYATPRTLTATDRVDAVLIHKVWGLLIFAAVMSVLFVSIFWLADPVMTATENAVKGAGKWLTSAMADGPLKSLVTTASSPASGRSSCSSRRSRCCSSSWRSWRTPATSPGPRS
jgi:hypothetical protein